MKGIEPPPPFESEPPAPLPNPISLSFSLPLSSLRMSRDSNGEVNIAAPKPTNQPTKASLHLVLISKGCPSLRPFVGVVLPAATVAGLSFASSSNTAAADGEDESAGVEGGRGRGTRRFGFDPLTAKSCNALRL